MGFLEPVSTETVENPSQEKILIKLNDCFKKSKDQKAKKTLKLSKRIDKIRSPKLVKSALSKDLRL